MISDLNNLREYNNVNVSVQCLCVVYDSVKKESVDYMKSHNGFS